MDVLISGAGIAGPALAFWLRQDGHAVTVVDRAPEMRASGHAVDIRGAAVEVVARMGLLNQVRAADTDKQGMAWVDDSGKRVVSVPSGFAEVAPEDVEIPRGSLSDILFEATRDTVEYVFGDRIAAMRQDAEGVDVTFEHGSPRRYHLVIGADGLHSTTRAMAFGPETDYVRHLGLHMAIFTTENRLDLDRFELAHMTPGRLATLTHSNGESGARAAFFFASPAGPADTPDHRDVEAQRAMVADAFANAGWEIPRLLRELRTAPDFYCDSTSQVVMDRWSAGRVALLGDAAYSPSPLSGQGSSLALVGAYVLASELGRAQGDHTAAFAGYETRMRDYVQQNQKLAKDNVTRFAPTSWGAIRFQNLAIKTMKYLPWRGYIIKQATQGLREASNAIALDA
ncbi:FAD-dependent monooxygenase [Kitasatospora sp. NBC_01287]|uniref:FAD-dependent monooxygenase n=1 Tax=Kitasatospora sp. NBC_01287 TaxID=2903573 RepID=UPI00224FFC5F|nr:FAD-dependent monooxygenase [Kitasatospora sp. NBC_01287]MCX4747989.1 FAD-dependent monooxygenase [Kitasatospora sp. NBC_01287]